MLAFPAVHAAAPSSSGLGRRPLKAVARVRIPSGLHPKGPVPESGTGPFRPRDLGRVARSALSRRRASSVVVVGAVDSDGGGSEVVSVGSVGSVVTLGAGVVSTTGGGAAGRRVRVGVGRGRGVGVGRRRRRERQVRGRFRGARERGDQRRGPADRAVRRPRRRPEEQRRDHGHRRCRTADAHQRRRAARRRAAGAAGAASGSSSSASSSRPGRRPTGRCRCAASAAPAARRSR